MLLTTKEFVEKYGLMAKKSLGQNFLLDANITDKIVRLTIEKQNLENLNDEKFIEIGPGPGGLTQAVLRQSPKKLTVIEMDERCLSILNEIKDFYPQLNIINGDALKFDWLDNFNRDGKSHIISNLPYNISVVLLTDFLLKIDMFNSLTLMFQKEVADRILANPGTKNYGRISVISQLQCDVVKLFDLPPSCFVPAPKIWSSVLLFKPKNNVQDTKLLSKIEMLTGLAFGQRRKMIRQSLKGVENIFSILADLGISAEHRAENLSPSDYLNIAKRLI